MYILYSGPMKGCAARKLIFDTFAHANLAHLLSRDEFWPEEFTKELALKQYEKVDRKGGKWSNTDDLPWLSRKEDYFGAT